jgi:pantetheine-phosphate adenylyltransferase
MPVTLALIPGSFDPIHLGHLDVIEAAAALFDRVVVAAVHNPGKDTFAFPLDEREAMIAATVSHLPTVEVTSFSGLVVDLVVRVRADVVVKGLRTAGDFEIEQQMAQTNRAVSGMRTVFVPTDPAHAFVSSRFIREIAKERGDVSMLVPVPVHARLNERFGA